MRRWRKDASQNAQPIPALFSADMNVVSYCHRPANVESGKQECRHEPTFLFGLRPSDRPRMAVPVRSGFGPTLVWA